MMDRVERRFDPRPRRLAGDTAYGAVRLLKWLVDRNITPHVPVWDKSGKTGSGRDQIETTFLIPFPTSAKPCCTREETF